MLFTVCWALTCSNFDKYLSTLRQRHWRTAWPFQHLCENDMLKILDMTPLWFENYLTWWYICSWTGIIHCPNNKSVCISGVFVWNNKIVFKITRRTENMRLLARRKLQSWCRTSASDCFMRHKLCPIEPVKLWLQLTKRTLWTANVCLGGYPFLQQSFISGTFIMSYES